MVTDRDKQVARLKRRMARAEKRAGNIMDVASDNDISTNIRRSRAKRGWYEGGFYSF